MAEKKSPAECDAERLQELVESPLAFDPNTPPERTGTEYLTQNGIENLVCKDEIRKALSSDAVIEKISEAYIITKPALRKL